MTKVQVPTIGGIRKVIKLDAATNPGTTIAEVGSGTISLSQLAQYITQLQTAQQNNTIGGGGSSINISTGPGLSGGGSVGNIRISLVAAIPALLAEDGADGDTGPPGPRGAPGATGAQGPALHFVGDDPTNDDGMCGYRAQPSAQSTGWGTPTNGAVVANFNAATANLTSCANALALIITALEKVGNLGP